MKTAVLRGSEHTRYGGVATVGEGPAAIAISIGGARKIYSHKDPNEDVAAFAQAKGGVLIVVGDGHGGHEASEQAVARLIEEHAPAWTDRDAAGLRERWSEVVSDVVVGLHAGIVADAARSGRTSARTTLALALARPDEGWMGWASLGDSHVFHVGTDGEVVDLASESPRGTWFLGHPASPAEELRARCMAGVEELAETRAVVVVTDGISERGIGVDVPEQAVAECAEHARTSGASPDLLPLGTARGVVERSLEAHRLHKAGDNVASAVVWIEDPRATPGA
jgi:hypothetical protein